MTSAKRTNGVDNNNSRRSSLVVFIHHHPSILASFDQGVDPFRQK